MDFLWFVTMLLLSFGGAWLFGLVGYLVESSISSCCYNCYPGLLGGGATGFIAGMILSFRLFSKPRPKPQDSEESPDDQIDWSDPAKR